LNIEYYTWLHGPVALDEEIEEPEADLDAAITVESEQVYQHPRMRIKALQSFDCLLANPPYMFKQLYSGRLLL
jgi:hypothetical protein